MNCMRSLLVGVLSLTLIGCSSPIARRTIPNAAGPSIERKPPVLKSDRARAKVASKSATKAAKASSVAAKSAKQTFPQPSKRFDKNKIASPIMMDSNSSASRAPQPPESTESVAGMDVSVATVGQVAETSHLVLEKAKATVAAKMEEPASVEFEDMTRAIRRDPYGQSIDTICGYVRGKKKSGAETGKRAFLYLVKDGIALVDYGRISLAETAYRNVCTNAGLKSAFGP